MYHLTERLDDIGKPAWIGLTILSFVLWWPLGLVVLSYLVGSGRMACWTQGSAGRWQRRMGRSAIGGAVVGLRLQHPPSQRHRQPCLRRIPGRDPAPARRRAARVHRIPRPAAPRQGQGRIRRIHGRTPPPARPRAVPAGDLKQAASIGPSRLPGNTAAGTPSSDLAPSPRLPAFRSIGGLTRCSA